MTRFARLRLPSKVHRTCDCVCVCTESGQRPRGPEGQADFVRRRLSPPGPRGQCTRHCRRAHDPSRDLLATICEELGIDTTGISDSSKGLVDALNGYLLERHAQGHRVVVVIDEAQNLSPEALEQVRLLTNLETSSEKLLQIILIGQPELAITLQRHDLRQLSQRIVGRFNLKPLSKTETREYIEHRLYSTGGAFSEAAVTREVEAVLPVFEYY